MESALPFLPSPLGVAEALPLSVSVGHENEKSDDAPLKSLSALCVNTVLPA